MWIELIFFSAFFSQIWLISYHYPNRILQRMDYIFEHYPADKYAKLYPKGYEKTVAGKTLYKLLNIAFLIIGLVIFVSIVVAIHLGKIQLRDMNFVPFAYGMLQAIPFLLLEVSAIKQFKLMRSINSESKRHADLSPRNVFNYVSATRLFSAIIMFFVCIYIMLSLNDFHLSSDISVLIGSMLLCNGLFVGLGYVLLRGKKLDPHQSSKDRRIMTSAVFRSYTSVSILVSVFFIINRCTEHYSIYNWEPIFNSLYWQSVVLLSTGAMLKLTTPKEVNFEVYRTSIPSNS
ncbi:MAG: hypothetical protein ABJK37_03105 [Paraglaciecola sp.]|uniref:hypothetical protein n=1 Tax=Paraglaciecola sp. TaxID=1920173 RepID=UPI0032973938